jgi:hypothetical protein
VLTCYGGLEAHLKRTGTKTYEIRITSSDMYRRFESPQMVACRSYFVGFYEPVAMVDERTDVQST